MIREEAVQFTVHVLRNASDWQEAQHRLADHERFGPWLTRSGDPVAASQAIIREAEQRLGSSLPY